jgi:hypothetical protein
MSPHVVEKLVEMAVGALLLASAVIRARRSYPAIGDLPRPKRDVWAFPLILQGSFGSVLLLLNLSDLMQLLGAPGCSRTYLSRSAAPAYMHQALR